jgi:hypothetical protein
MRNERMHAGAAAIGWLRFPPDTTNIHPVEFQCFKFLKSWREIGAE